MQYLIDFLSPGSAEADIGWGGTLNSHMMATCSVQFSLVCTLLQKFLRCPLRKLGWKNEYSAELWIIHDWWS